MKDSFPELPASNKEVFHLPFFSCQDYSHDGLIEHVIRHFNQCCSIMLSSFSITENALRTFYLLHEEKLVSSMQCLFDHNVKKHKLPVFLFGMNLLQEIYLDRNHSKIVLLDFGEFSIAIIGSANLTVNDKLESGIITNDPFITCFFRQKLQAAMSNAYACHLHDIEC